MKYWLITYYRSETNSFNNSVWEGRLMDFLLEANEDHVIILLNAFPIAKREYNNFINRSK